MIGRGLNTPDAFASLHGAMHTLFHGLGVDLSPQSLGGVANERASYGGVLRYSTELSLLTVAACAEANAAQSVELVLSAGADPKVRDEGVAPLGAAAAMGWIDVIEQLVSAGARPAAADLVAAAYGCSSASDAAALALYELVQIDAFDSREIDESPFAAAWRQCRYRVVEAYVLQAELLRRGCSIVPPGLLWLAVAPPDTPPPCQLSELRTALDAWGRGSFAVAAGRDQADMLAWMRAAGIRPSVADWWSAMESALEHGRPESVSWLLAEPPSLSPTDRRELARLGLRGGCARCLEVLRPGVLAEVDLHTAQRYLIAEVSSPAAVDVILDLGWGRESAGRCVLQSLASRRAPEALMALLGNRSFRWTGPELLFALQEAVACDSIPSVVALIEAGADVTIPDPDDWLPIAFCQSPQMVEIILSAARLQSAALDAFASQASRIHHEDVRLHALARVRSRS